jgi:peptide deformylase
MAILEILKYPDSRLREKAASIKEISKETKKLAVNLVETMYNARGVGLAATQVGVPLRIIVIDVGQLEEKPEPFVCLNPEIVYCEGKDKFDEGCLSFPGYSAPVERYDKINVRYTDIHGAKHTGEAEGLLARVFQHEIDHLNGVLFTDHLSKLRRELLLNKIRKSMEKSL